MCAASDFAPRSLRETTQPAGGPDEAGVRATSRRPHPGAVAQAYVSTVLDDGAVAVTVVAFSSASLVRLSACSSASR